MQELYVDTPEKLAELAALLAGSPWLALDTEFIRERTYFARLCLIQVANNEYAACIDPLAIDDLQPLHELLLDEQVIKVFHAARQDLEIFLHDWQLLPVPLFDTQPAAALLGYGDQVGYAKLINQVLGKELAKDHSRTDWSHRPLDEGQLRYALDDVIYLGKAFEQMQQKLVSLDRLQWLEKDFAELTSPATYELNPMEMWRRVKGRQHLRGLRLAVLQQLAAWREERALKRDLPRKWVIKDEVITEMARRMPTNEAQLAKIRGLEPGHIRRDGKALLQRIEAAQQLAEEDWPRDKRPAGALKPQQEAMIDLLSSALRLIGEAHQLTPGAIAGRKQLEKLVRGDADNELMRGWRKTVAGDTLEKILRGEQQLVNRQGHLEVTPVDATP